MGWRLDGVSPHLDMLIEARRCSIQDAESTSRVLTDPEMLKPPFWERASECLLVR
jgi:hypothetical protein